MADANLSGDRSAHPSVGIPVKRPQNDTPSQTHVPVERRPGNPQRLADVVDLQGLVGVELLGEHDLRLARRDLGASAVATSGARGGQAGFGAFLDQAGSN